MSHGPEDIGRFSGCWLGVIVENNDTDEPVRNRCKVKVPGVYADDSSVDDLPWAEYCATGNWGIAKGQRKPPPIGLNVWVMFRQGHAEYPVVMGQSLIDQDDSNGTEISVTDGDHSHMIRGAQETAAASKSSFVATTDEHYVDGKGKYHYRDLDFVVVNNMRYFYSTKEENVSGGSTEKVGGGKIIQIQGCQKIDINDGIDKTVGGDERSFVMGRMLARCANVLGSPFDDGMLFSAINSFFHAEAKDLAGIQGAELVLDPDGILTRLTSLVTLLIDAPIVSIGLGASSFVTTELHTHPVVGGGITGPAVGVPGLGYALNLLVA